MIISNLTWVPRSELGNDFRFLNPSACHAIALATADQPKNNDKNTINRDYMMMHFGDLTQ
jgi:hypothetical protein